MAVWEADIVWMVVQVFAEELHILKVTEFEGQLSASLQCKAMLV